MSSVGFLPRKERTPNCNPEGTPLKNNIGIRGSDGSPLVFFSLPERNAHITLHIPVVCE